MSEADFLVPLDFSVTKMSCERSVPKTNIINHNVCIRINYMYSLIVKSTKYIKKNKMGNLV